MLLVVRIIVLKFLLILMNYYDIVIKYLKKWYYKEIILLI